MEPKDFIRLLLEFERRKQAQIVKNINQNRLGVFREGTADYQRVVDERDFAEHRLSEVLAAKEWLEKQDK